MTDHRSITHAIALGTIDAELAALVWLLADARVPLVVAAPDVVAGETLRASFTHLAAKDAMTVDGLAGGAVIARSFDEVVRLGGGQPGAIVPDEARDLGVVLVLGETAASGVWRVTSAHYVRQLERDAEGHVQRRPPALLAAWDDERERFDHFAWGVMPELVLRAGVDRAAFEDAHDHRARLLAELASAGITDPAELRRAVDAAALAGQQRSGETGNGRN